MNANKLKGRMAEQGMTQGMLAKKCGMSSNSLSRKMLKKREFTLGEVVRICEVLSINDPTEFFFESKSQKCNER